MNTTFVLTGGAGRIINSIPALEKYNKLNPEDDFKILVYGWDSVFWSHPTLQKRVYNADQKGVFNNIIKNSKVVVPEPYHNFRFYNQKINLVEAFDEEINKTENHKDLNYLCLHLSEYEIFKSKEYIENLKTQKKRKKIIVFQPYGSAVELIHNQPIDKSNRSFYLKDYFKIVQSLSSEAVILYASMPEFRHASDSFSVSFDDFQPYHRSLMCMIYHSDYYLGCCSVGQHTARALGKPGLIVMGGTNEVNFSYPNHFKIYRKKNVQPVYVPWRLSELDSKFADRENEGLMRFDDKEIDEIINIVKKEINYSTIEKIGNSEMQYD